MQKYDANRGSLLREVHVTRTRNVAVNTTYSAHLTADCIHDALEERSRKPIVAMTAASVRMSQREQRVTYPE